MLDARPAPPVWRGKVADVCPAGIGLLALEQIRRGGHAPARHRQLAVLFLVADDGRLIVRKDAGKGREVAGAVQHRAGHFLDRLLVGGLAAKIIPMSA